ncbi:protein AMBP isoform X1 [Labrus bergylta]|uniref:protein AMBP isoform X1 n=2 Tax=Labrus bergylta TaxID=56723 RepID=UPI0033136341
MLSMVSLVSLLVLGLAWTLKAIPVHSEPLVTTQESFDVDRFMGRWFEVAVVSTCPHYMEHKRGNPAIVAMELQQIATIGNFTMTSTSLRNGSCKQTTTHFSVTDTPGRFFHHFARFGADVDSFVVHTNYDGFAMMLQLSTEKPSGIQTIKAKLYSRTMNMGSDVMENFKTLVRHHGMSDDNIIINQSKGECVPGEQVTKPTPAQSQGESSS